MLEKTLSELNLSLEKKKFEKCVGRLSRSQSLQDYLLPFSSKAHFDNCAFQKSINYINRLIAQNDYFSKKYKLKTSEKDKRLLKRKILFNTGKILHAVQDFYAHSNYLEIMQVKHARFEDVPVLNVGKKEDQTEVIRLRDEKAMISGVAWWVFPKRCPKGTLSHDKLAKDSPKHKSGKKLTVWKNPTSNEYLTGFEASIILAERATNKFLLHTFEKYPMLKTHCGTPKGQ